MEKHWAPSYAAGLKVLLYSLIVYFLDSVLLQQETNHMGAGESSS